MIEIEIEIEIEINILLEPGRGQGEEQHGRALLARPGRGPALPRGRVLEALDAELRGTHGCAHLEEALLRRLRRGRHGRRHAQEALYIYIYMFMYIYIYICM